MRAAFEPYAGAPSASLNNFDTGALAAVFVGDVRIVRTVEHAVRVRDDRRRVERADVAAHG
jgi:hypothetical protein